MSCGHSNEATKATAESDVSTNQPAAEIVENKLCFRNEHPFKDAPSKQDVEELNLEIEGENVTGIYNWLPAEKDQRKGSLTGTIKDKVIQAQYTFTQEGTEKTTKIKITLAAEQATVSGGPPVLGLGATLGKVACQ